MGSWNFGPRHKETKKVIEVAKFIINKIYSKKKIKIIFKKVKFKKITSKTEKYLDNVLSKKFLQSYFKKYE